MASFVATYNRTIMRPKFDAIGRPLPHENAVMFDSKTLKSAHRFFRAVVQTHHGVDLDDADYTLRPAVISRSDMGFLDNPNPPRVLEKPGRCGTEDRT